MCDTDDTDDLLLIPPDFFVIDSDSGDSTAVGPYYNIVDRLIKQVSDLKNRIDSIESVSLSNPLDYYFDHSDSMQNSSPRFRKYNSIDDLYVPQSTQSTPQKPHTKFKLNSLPTSPNVDRFSPAKNIRMRSPVRANFSPRSTKKPPITPPVKDDGQMLTEIDTFLSKVKTIQRISAARNLEKEFNEGTAANINSTELHRLLVDLDRQHQKNEQEISKIEKELVHNKEPIVTKEKTWRQGDNKESVPDYGLGAKETLYKDSKLSKPQEDLKKQTKFINDKSPANDSWPSVDPFSDSSSDSAQLTAYNKFHTGRGDLLSSPIHTNALHLLNMHKKLLEGGAQKMDNRGKTREHKPRGANTINDNLGLLRLADIWNTNPQRVHLNSSQLSQKLQEEKLRRQHCEELIQELQNRNLELQQKLSVALKVDETKNNTIHQFQEVLERIVTRLERNNKEKQEWDEEVSRMKVAHSKEIEEAHQKIAYYEKEVSKALNLAHGNQDKLSSLEKQCSVLRSELQSLERKYKDIQDEYARETDRNKQLTEVLAQKELELTDNKNIINDARIEISQSKRAVEVCQAEFTGIKNECAKLQNELKDEREKIVHLNEQRGALINEVERHKRREEELKEERDKVKKQLENSKIELRNFYQGQVEILVQNKLKEFQGQLDQAEATFKEEIKKKEMSIAKTAAMHIQQISEKYTLEIKLLEKKHQEEIKLYQIQIVQHKQQAESLQHKLDQLHEKRIQIAKQLQKIMESQWAEALRIITSGKSPTFNDDTFSTIDQLNSLKTRSYNNVEEVLAQQQDDQYNMVRKSKNEHAFSLPNEETLSSVSNNFEKIPQEMYGIPNETPVSSRTQGHKQYSDTEIQKYIYLLLNKPPGNPIQEAQQKDGEKASPDNAHDRAAWQHDQESTNRISSRGYHKERRYPKPPWK